MIRANTTSDSWVQVPEFPLILLKNRSFQDFNFDLSKLNLSQKQINYISNKAKKLAKEVTPTYNLYFLNEIYENHHDRKYQDFFDVLYEAKLEEHKKEFFYLIEEYYTSVQPLINKIHRLKSDLDGLRDIGRFKDRQNPLYKEFKEKRKALKYCQDNQNFSERYFNLFNKTGIFKYLEKAVNVQRSALSYYIKLKCNSCGYEEHLRKYDSNDRFDSFSNDQKVEKRKLELRNSLDFLDQKGLTYSFFTLTVENLQFDEFTKDSLKTIQKLTKEFFRYRFKEEDIYDYSTPRNQFKREDFKHLVGQRIEDVYKGYYGVFELTHNEETNTFHPHIHYLLIRDKPKHKKDYITGFIPKEYLTEAWKTVCSHNWKDDYIQHLDKFKRSEILDIGAKNLKKYYSNPHYNASSYILQYVTKGVKVKDDEAFEKILLETNGIRFERSGGLLSAKSRKRMAALMEFLFQCRAGEVKLIPCSYNGVQRVQLFSWQSFYDMFFVKKGCSCPFCRDGNMLFYGVSDTEFFTDLSNPLNLQSCLTNLGIDQYIQN